jgi:hypothetical protein
MTAITLFDAAQQVRQHLGEIDPDTGELSDAFTQSLDLFQQKGAACVAYDIDETSTIKAMKEALARASEHLKAREARHERFRAYMADCMKATGVSKLSSPDGLFTATLYADRDVSVEIDEGAEFPPELCNEPRPPAPSKTKIRAAIEAGEPISGARIVRKDRLTIK